MNWLADIPKLPCFKPQGAFYCFPNVSQYFGLKTGSGKSINNSVELATYLLEEYLLATVPGDPFGAPQNLRLSYATNLDILEKGLDRLRQGLANLK